MAPNLFGRNRVRRVAILRMAVGRHRQPEMTAQRVMLVFGAEQSALLQNRHDTLAEQREIPRPGHAKDETIRRASGKPTFDLFGDGLGRADEIGSKNAKAIGGLPQCQLFLRRHCRITRSG